jgi:hypothetical protein
MKKVSTILEAVYKLDADEYAVFREGLTQIESARASAQAALFVRGMTVQFKGRKGVTIFGVVEKVGSKNVMVRESFRESFFQKKDESQKDTRWRVHPSFLKETP